MPTNFVPFRRRTLASVVAALCGSLPLTSNAASDAGRVDFAVGNVTAIGGDGMSRAVSKGAAIKIGDTIETNSGRAWLRFKDGGYMSLQPGTEFRVDDYHFEGDEDGSEKSFFSLLKGGVRAVTGLIGHRNRNSYRVNTPVATIGIRGTEYIAQLGNSLLLSCGEGVCVITNDAGEVELSAGETVYLEDQTSAPERTTRRVVLPPNPPVEYTIAQQSDPETGIPLGLIIPETPEEPEVPEVPEPPVFSEDVPLVPGEQSGLFLALSYGGEGSGSFANEHDARLETGRAEEYVVGTFDESLVLQQAEWNRDADSNEFLENVRFTNIENGAISADTGTDGVIAWGRWTGDYVAGTVFEDGGLIIDEDDQSVHYVTGVPTPESDLMNLAALNAVATYNLIGATTPTFGEDGYEGFSDFGSWVSVRGALAADFGKHTVNTSIVLHGSKNDLTITSGAMPIAAGAGGAFGGNGAWSTSTHYPPANYQTKIAGFFAGGGASRAGYGYDVVVDGPSYPAYTINGAVAFKQGGSTRTISLPVVTQD